MKLAAKDLGAFLAAPVRNSRAFLVYGADEGQMRDIARKAIAAILGSQYDPLNLTEITGNQLKEDGALLADALNSYSLMGGERLVWLRDPAENQAESTVALLKEGAPAAYLLVSAGELTASSKWRTAFEKEKMLAAYPCYRDEGMQLNRLIAENFSARGIKAPPEVINYMAANLGNDRGVTLQEIEKIDIFLGEERALSLEQAMALTGNNRELTLDDMCHAVAGGQPVQLPVLLKSLFEDGMQPIAIFRILHSHFQKLRQLHLMVAEGVPLETAFKQMRVFFKQEPKLRDQLRRWSDQRIVRAMDALLEAERQIKTSPVSAELLCSQLLHRLSVSAVGKK